MYNQFEINILTKDLLRALSLTNSVVEKRNVLPILGNIKLETENNALQIVATDNDLTIVQHVGADVKLPGAITVDAGVFGEIIRKLPDQEINLKYDHASSQLSVRGKNCFFQIAVIAAEEFPPVDHIDAEHSISVDCKDLEGLLETTKFSMSNEETRYNMNGIFLHLVNENDGSFLASATTDGHRLSMNKAALESKYDNEFGVILPKKTVLELSKILKSNAISANIDIRVGINKCEFNCGNIIVLSKLIDGTFPEYHAFIPADHPASLNIASSELAAAIDRASIVTIDKFRAIKLSITSSKMDITASGESRGSALEVLNKERNPSFSFDGEELKIGFNPKYILDILGCIGEEVCTVHLANNSAPALITSDAMPHAKFVIMPVRI